MKTSLSLHQPQVLLLNLQALVFGPCVFIFCSIVLIIPGDGVICDKFMEGSGTRRVKACPGEEYCSYVFVDFGNYDYGEGGIETEVGEFY